MSLAAAAGTSGTLKSRMLTGTGGTGGTGTTTTMEESALTPESAAKAAEIEREETETDTERGTEGRMRSGTTEAGAQPNTGMTTERGRETGPETGPERDPVTGRDPGTGTERQASGPVPAVAAAVRAWRGQQRGTEAGRGARVGPRAALCKTCCRESWPWEEEVEQE